MAALEIVGLPQARLREPEKLVMHDGVERRVGEAMEFGRALSQSVRGHRRMLSVAERHRRTSRPLDTRTRKAPQ